MEWSAANARLRPDPRSQDYTTSPRWALRLVCVGPEGGQDWLNQSWTSMVPLSAMATTGPACGAVTS